MKISRIKINRFGKLSGEMLEFDDGINVVYGPNESGKSTLFGFIIGMLFGISKSRGRASKTDDFTRFEPKEIPLEYSGSMEFEQSGKRYVISRDFAAGHKRDTLIDADGNKVLSDPDAELGRLFGGVTKDTYKNTQGILQESVLDNFILVNSLTDKYSDMDSPSQYDGIVSKSLSEIEAMRKEMESEKKREQKKRDELARELSLKMQYADSEADDLEKKLSEEKLSERNRTHADAKIDDRQERAAVRPKALAMVILIAAAVCIGIYLAFAGVESPFLTVFMIIEILLALSVFFAALSIRKGLRRMEQRTDEEPLFKQDLTEYLSHELMLKKKLKEKLAAEYEKTVSGKGTLEELETRISGLKLAEETIREIAEDSKIKYEKAFEDRAAKIFEYLSADENRKLIFDDELKAGLLSGGIYIPFWQLSKGTRDIIEISMRLSAADIIAGGGEMPLILDDTFVNCDDDRLKRVLMFLKNLKRQVILFTCQRRESEILDELGLNYKKVRWSGSEEIA
jgi:DNA repair exonuclease SbcCD ATPase subunit